MQQLYQQQGFYEGWGGPVEPATGSKVMALFKEGIVDGLPPGLSDGHSTGTISEAPTGLIKKTSTRGGGTEVSKGTRVGPSRAYPPDGTSGALLPLSRSRHCG